MTKFMINPANRILNSINLIENKAVISHQLTLWTARMEPGDILHFDYPGSLADENGNPVPDSLLVRITCRKSFFLRRPRIDVDYMLSKELKVRSFSMNPGDTIPEKFLDEISNNLGGKVDPAWIPTGMSICIGMSGERVIDPEVEEIISIITSAACLARREKLTSLIQESTNPRSEEWRRM